jgi:predicted kinase
MTAQRPQQVTSNKARLILVCGLPGSGKTTHARALEAGLRAVRFAPDEWMSALAIDIYDEPARARIEQLQWSLCERLLALGLTVIVEWGTWARSERDALRLRARELGAAVELHYLFAPEDMLFQRIRRRGMENPPIEQDALSQWCKQFEVPSHDERALYDRVEEIDGAHA